MILLLTDFGVQGPYVGQLKAVLRHRVPEEIVVDLMHDLPHWQVRSASYLLPAVLQGVPESSIVVCVVDPGVGGSRGAVVIKVDGRWLVGPDNGVFDRIASLADRVEWYDISWRPDCLSHSFHGRDLFAPVAAAIAKGEWHSYLTECPAKPLRYNESSLNEVIYIDGYGNCVTGIQASSLEDEASVLVAGKALRFAKTFCAVEEKSLFWYRNSLGLVEIAANQASAQQLLALNIGSKLLIKPAPVY